jgi:hypothetical protein
MEPNQKAGPPVKRCVDRHIGACSVCEQYPPIPYDYWPMPEYGVCPCCNEDTELTWFDSVCFDCYSGPND